ncbi:molybdenum cofactor synthesis domain protein [Cellulomonas flavigena DSM 20109]|uniref:Molybdopterin molybdenumtransferase n=1 Tax=Cellulomonas flavigena (strain ATCC 482 / DSM 20109 / BCRC 11376 / JCM 18109 / NBRC 3775 / NCIMB 8073 / NRS 134) TaxID=446466 RepID=D5UK05_CELFN|nr:gephyrin-like molybdotransferase Glp [Cellulomonas flavigena]ADG73747.1 molybdenum cofactor synthesis domain protein [Cellulomonas flavigena DSM 20109]
MRSVQEHLAAVLGAAGPVPPLDVVLHDASGCILAADVVSPVDVPAVPVAARDGYAVVAQDTVTTGGAGPGLPVAHDLHAGSPAGLRHVRGTAVRVASGAPLPLGADAVVPVEETDRGQARVAFQRAVGVGQHVRGAGADVRAGDVVLTAGTRLGARQIALAATMGRGRLPVHPTPRVVLMSVGDELVEPTTAARPGTVFEVDGHALEAAVRDAGATPVRVGVVPDDHAALREALEDQLVRADLLVLTGGLSELARDTVKDVLAPLGSVRLDQVAMTPGLRQGFGVVGALGLDAAGDGGRTVPLFALQGHPVAAQVSFEVFVRPALRAMAGHAELFRPSVAAVATQGWVSPPGLRQFVPATVLGSPDEGYRATPVGDPAAPSTAGLAQANALAVVGEQDRTVHPGDVVHCLVLEG